MDKIEQLAIRAGVSSSVLGSARRVIRVLEGSTYRESYKTLALVRKSLEQDQSGETVKILE